MTRLKVITDFVATMYPAGTAGYMNLWTSNGSRSHWHDVAADHRHKADAAISINQTGEVWYQTGLTAEALGEKRRGREVEMVAVPGLHADVDWQHPCHKKADRLPPTLEDALSIIHAAPLPPTLIVHSGHGLQPYWLFHATADTTAPEARQRVKSLLVRWQAMLRATAEAKGWTVDATANLDRLMRIPGTFNRKPGHEPVPVTVLEQKGDRYTPEQLEAALPPEAPAGADEIDFTEASPSVSTPATPPARSVTIQDATATLADDDLIVKASNAQGPSGAKFRALYCDGSMNGYPSQSEAMQALLCLLAFWTRKNAAQMERLAARSKLAEGYEKWHARPDYRARSIAAALKLVTKTYDAPTPDDCLWDSDADLDAPDISGKTYPATDAGNAEMFAAAYGHRLRYVPQWRAWLAWTGSHWRRDDTATSARRKAYDLVRRQMYGHAQTIKDDDQRQAYTKHIYRSQSARAIDAIVKIAETLLPVRPEKIDADPYLFNAQNGTLDLRTGELRPHDPADLLTKLSPVTYDPGATCPTFEAFIGRIFQDADGKTRDDLEAYVQKAAGYSLTGDTGEQCIFVAHGAGRNGKTTLLNAMKFVSGDYAMTARCELLMKSANKTNHEGEANLFGRRLVVSSETNEGQAFDESTVKRLADKQTIRARQIYGREFEFKATHKIFLDCNHLPSIRGDDMGIWRRIKRIPFEATISEAERDNRLDEKLEAEASGILNWMLAGLGLYQRDGLKDPACVSEANREYRDDSDILGQFLRECTQNNDAGEVSAAGLYVVYSGWCKTNGLSFPLTSAVFGKRLKGRGYTPHKGTAGARRWRGLELLPDAARVCQVPDSHFW